MTGARRRSRLPFGEGRSEVSKASHHRLRDAQTLLGEGRFRGAMYLAGYVVECKLKAKLMSCYNALTLGDLQTRLKDRLEDPDLRLRVHSLEQLGRLLPRWRQVCEEPRFRSCWEQVRSWSVAWRYAPEPEDREEAQSFPRSVEEALLCLESRF